MEIPSMTAEIRISSSSGDHLFSKRVGSFVAVSFGAMIKRDER